MRTSTRATIRLAALASWQLVRSLSALWLGFAVLGAVFFGPNGLYARDVTRGLRALPAVAPPLVALWGLLHLRATRALFASPDLAFVRAQPVSLARWNAALCAISALPHVALFAFVARGEGAVLGVAVAALCWTWTLLAAAPALHARTLAALALLAAAGPLAFWPPGAPLVALFALALAGPWAALDRWRAHGDRPTAPPSRPLFARPVVALVRAHALALVRNDRAAVARAGALATACGALAALAAHNTGRSAVDPGALATVLLLLPAPALAAVSVGVVTRSEAAMERLLASSPAGARRALHARRASVAGACGACGALLGALASSPCGLRAALLGAALCASVFVALGAVTLALSRRAAPAGVALIAGVCAIIVAMVLRPAVLALLACSAALLALAARPAREAPA